MQPKYELTENPPREAFQKIWAPLLKFYSDRGLLKEVDAEGTEDDVAKRALASLADLR